MNRILKLELPASYRMIVISDIHGDLKGFQKLLEKVNYQSSDYLLIVGDICEKGSDSSGTVRFIRELAEKNKKVYACMGNCDDTYEVIRQGNEKVIPYLLWRKESLINEWLAALGYTVSADTGCEDIIALLEESEYREDIDFLAQLPIAIETDDFIFVHAGIENRADWQNGSPDFMTAAKGFYQLEHQSSKTVIVGHYPVCIYDKNQLLNMNPHLNYDKRIFAIDGGNVVKSEIGQLNALVIEKAADESNISTTYVKKETILRSINRYRAEGQVLENVVWPDYEIEIIRVGKHFSQCRTVNQTVIDIKNELIHENKCLADTTSYHFSYNEDEEFELLSDRYSAYYLLKQEGVVGWARKEDFILVSAYNNQEKR